MNIQNHRQPGESAVAYRHRRREVNKILRHYLRVGSPATHSNKLDGPDKLHALPMRYVPGPHKTHKPHKVEQKGMRLSPYGVPEPHVWTVMHPGTLVKGLPE